ncbi:glycosyltransferase [Agromyces protaetiae]|uniref:Glycosyltransferase n=1 Tax=Agromyces protaetiae TaxID=2509455 RepID=A0A4P6FP05_9MICO|nr:glycosyltransferase [Agromyces protaetiae]QAY72218.1 glycosyltransferase [Agromyces protaetiae]
MAPGPKRVPPGPHGEAPATPPAPTVTVVIPSYRRLERLPPLIRTYREQGADEIVVVLDGPHPGWAEALDGLADRAPVVVRELPVNRGLALARIAGLERATSDVVILADDDVAPKPGLVDHHRTFHAANPDHALLGYMPVRLPARRSRDQAATFLYARDYANQVEAWRTGSSADLLQSFWGGNASVPRERYLAAESFKPSVRLDYNEDLDLGLRLLAIGVHAAFDERAAAEHLHSRSLKAFLAECVVRGESVHEFELRWPVLPRQLAELVLIPDDHHPFVAAAQRRIAARDTPALLERTLVAGYHATGAVHAWRAQEAITRLLRRGLAMRGYRLRVARSAGAGTGHPDVSAASDASNASPEASAAV